MHIGDAWSDISEIREKMDRAWRWWVDTLWQTMPERVRALFTSEDSGLAIDIFDGQIVLWRVIEESSVELARGSLDDADMVDLKGKVADQLSLVRAERVYLRLPSNEVLLRNIHLPLAAAHDLDDILTHELERQSPLDPSEIYFDRHIVARDKAANRLDIQLRLVKRAVVDPAVELCRSLDLEPVSIQFWTDGSIAGRPFIINRGILHRARLRFWSTAGLAILVMALAIGAMSAALARAEASAAALAAEVRKARIEAEGSEKIKAEIDRAEARIEFLAQQKKSPLFVRTLSEVTRILPDDSWIFGLELNGNEIRIRGYSPAAADLIGRFDGSTSFANAQFRSPLVQGGSKDLERFDLSFEIRKARS